MAVVENEGKGRTFYDETENTDYVHVFDNVAKYLEKEDEEKYRGKERKVSDLLLGKIIMLSYYPKHDRKYIYTQTFII